MSALPTTNAKDQRLSLGQVLQWLRADGLVDPAQADALHADAMRLRPDLHPLVVVADAKLKSHAPPHRLLTLDVLSEWLATKVGLAYARIDPLKVDFSRVADLMSVNYATRFRILPIEIKANEVVIATSEPYLVEWLPEMERMWRRDIRRVFANPNDVTRYIAEFFSLARSVKGAAAKGGAAAQNSFEQLVELGNAKAGNRQYDSNDAHIVQIVDWLWQYAFDQRASDIHLEPRRDQGVVRFRIDGVLHQVYQVPGAVMSAMTSRIKLLGRMDVIEKRRPQDGRIKTLTASGVEVELRLSTLPTAFGEKLVMRIFDPDVVVKDFADLGFSDDDARRWNAMTARPYGIVLVTGPTGSGKTTTLYSTLKTLATEEVNVCTIEDPIEMVEGAFNQMQVQHGIDLGFADGVRALMRQDPDIIMVGEIRDLETAEMAVQAALTGHLVFSTVHTNDAPSADHAAARARRAAVPAERDGDRHHGAAARAHAVPALQGARPGRGRRVEGADRAVQDRAAGAAREAGRLHRMPDDRLPRSHRHLRDPRDDARREDARVRRAGHRRDPQARLARRHATAARLRRAEGRRRRDDDRGSAEGDAERRGLTRRVLRQSASQRPGTYVHAVRAGPSAPTASVPLRDGAPSVRRPRRTGRGRSASGR